MSGPRKLYAPAAQRMTRQQALETLAAHGDEIDQGKARLLLAGPVITEEDEARLASFRFRPRPMVFHVNNAILERLRCARLSKS